MNEIPSGHQEDQLPIKELRVGQWFRPFEGLVKFPEMQKEAVNAAISNWEGPEDIDILERPIRFGGISGALVLYAHLNIDINEPPETPLGKVKFVVSFEDAHISLEEAPLGIELHFDPVSEDDHEILRRYGMEFDLEGKKYYLLRDKQDEDEGEIGFSFDSILRQKGVEMYGSPLVYLPYDPQKIASIQARIVEK